MVLNSDFTFKLPVADFDFKLEFDCRNTIEKNNHVLFSVKRKG